MAIKGTPVSDEFFILIKIKLAALGQMKHPVVTGSMEPLIAVGSWIEVKPCKIKDLNQFDIIVFHQFEKLICHYVWYFSKLKQDEVITRSLVGGEDMPINENHLLGRVVNFDISKFQRFKIFLKNMRRK
jgi:hypothetical protein